MDGDIYSTRAEVDEQVAISHEEAKAKRAEERSEEAQREQERAEEAQRRIAAAENDEDGQTAEEGPARDEFETITGDWAAQYFSTGGTASRLPSKGAGLDQMAMAMAIEDETRAGVITPEEQELFLASSEKYVLSSVFSQGLIFGGDTLFSEHKLNYKQGYETAQDYGEENNPELLDKARLSRLTKMGQEIGKEVGTESGYSPEDYGLMMEYGATLTLNELHLAERKGSDKLLSAAQEWDKSTEASLNVQGNVVVEQTEAPLEAVNQPLEPIFQPLQSVTQTLAPEHLDKVDSASAMLSQAKAALDELGGDPVLEAVVTAREHGDLSGDTFVHTLQYMAHHTSDELSSFEHCNGVDVAGLGKLADAEYQQSRVSPSAGGQKQTSVNRSAGR